MAGTLIINPYSGRWKGRAARPEIDDALRAERLQIETRESQHSGEVLELARSAAQAGQAPLLVAGGDGTVGEVINGLYQANPDGVLGPIGIFPLGTANDLVVNLGLPTEPAAIAAAVRRGKTRRIDLGRVNGWVFDNNSAVGLEPVVTLYNTRMRRLRGIVRYLVAALRAITDGMLTFVFGYARTRRKMLSLLPKTMSGLYVDDPAIHQHHTRRLVITAHPATPLQVDGELRSQAIERLEYEVIPQKLDVFVE
jgi:diacylglycerol kinase family enzyme